VQSRFVEVGRTRLHYLEQGSGDPILLLHGWPTSSFLWRRMLGPLAQHHRVIALDLPGYGRSDRPRDVSYGLPFHAEVLTGLLDALALPSIGLVVHDLGGPVGLYWCARNPGRLRKLALLNTLVYARLSWAARAFLAAARLPGIRSCMVSPKGLAATMRMGVADPSRLTAEAVRGVQEPFADPAARAVLLEAGALLHPDELREIEHWLRRIDVPVRIVYGERDWLLPDVARTMRRVAQDVPGGVEVTALPDCGHFLQEEQPLEVAELLSRFFRAPDASSPDLPRAPGPQ
jgi:pimeloyl-ACP methyl ester carboxylesterase